MKRLSACLISAVCILSCGRDGTMHNSLTLGEINLFNADSVAAFLSDASPNQADSSKKFFLLAVGLFKNNNDVEAGIKFFIKSLTFYPTASAYYELGDAYLQSGNAGAALEAFKMAEKLDYSPFGNVLFKEACCYAELGDDKTTDYLKFAIENGFVDRDKIFSNKSLIKFDNGNQRIERVYNDAMVGNGDVDAVLWEGYSRQFQPATFPLVIDSGTFKSIGQPVYISYDYDKYITEMRDGKFSRDVGNNFFYYTKVADTTAFKTVIYGAQPFEDDGGPVYYYLASFNNKGRLVDKKMVAGAKTFGDLFKVFTMPASYKFQIQEYKNTYLKNTDNNGFDENLVISRELVKTTAYHIDSTGKFIEAPVLQ